MAKRRIAAALFVLLLLAASLPADNAPKKHFGLIFGTAYGPDDHPMYGVRVEIHPAGQKRPRWELVSDHRGEFAQRVPPGPADYVITGEATVVDPQTHKKNRLKGESKVRIEGEERQDVSLHLNQ